MDQRPVLTALRECSTWEEAARSLGVSVEQARAAVEELLRASVPPSSGEITALEVSARVVRDGWGVPHVLAGSAADAYFGLGFAMGQDRLWQMDYLRRAAGGTLAEVLGAPAVENDRLARTLGLQRVAEAGVERFSGEAREALEYFSGGVNLARALAERDGLPFEFALLEYAPQPWTPADTLLVLRGFWWQLTGRFPILCIPEFARRTLGEGLLFEAFLTHEGAQTTVWPRGVPYPDLPRWSGGRPRGKPPTDSGAVGSNNWVVAPSRAEKGAPLLASDPHVPLALPAVWYEARLRGGDLDACGACYAGVPGIFFGRNRDVAWGLTNNISSLRDLYLEVTHESDPSRYLRRLRTEEGVREEWKGMAARREVIEVRGGTPLEIEVREVEHGPVVSEVLPEFARAGEVVSLRWVGHEPTEELQAMIGYARARSVAEFRERLRGWSCPTFNWLLADRSGEIGYQLTGRIPLRRVAPRGYLSGADPEGAWAGYVPWEALPATGEPPEGWLASANNIVVTDAWPYPLSGTWPSDYRMQRLVQCLSGPGRRTAQDMATSQMDEYSPRAAEWALPAVAALREVGISHPLLEEIERWDFVYGVESRPACVFERFFVAWSRAALLQRFPETMFSFFFPNTAGLVEQLLVRDGAGWFACAEDRAAALRLAWSETLEWLEARLGPDQEGWRWGKVHTLTLAHPLGRSPLLREVLGRGPVSHGGTWNTLNNGLYEPGRPFETFSGVSFRLLVDLAGETRSVNSGGQSGHPGSPHYADQVPLWQTGGYHPLDLDKEPEGETWSILPG
jgi:penicillin amidase